VRYTSRVNFNKMRVLFCHNYYKDRGGEDQVFDYESELFKKNGYEVIKYCKRSTDIGNILKNFSVFLNSFFSLKTISEIKKIIEEKRPDIAHIHNIFPIISPSIYYVLQKNKIPIIQTIHNYRFYCSNGLSLKNDKICNKCEELSFKNVFYICNKDKKLYDLLLSLIIYINRKFKVYNKIDYFIAPSKFIKNKLISFGIGRNKIILRRNFVKKSKEKVDGVKNFKTKYFTFIGRISREKGVIELIKVFKEIRNVELMVIGDGPLKNTIERIIKRERISNIKILGFISGEKKDTIISHGIANIIPSICYENCPLVLAECLKGGVPVIVNDLGALSEYIKDEYNGYVYNFNNLNTLREKILKLYSMKSYELDIMRKNCKVSFEVLFSEKKNFEIIDSLYKKLISRKSEES